jgi:thiol:disulfide interchange protein DsbA
VKLIKQLFVLLALLCVNPSFAEPEIVQDYQIINPAQPTRSGNKIEVLEFFFYGCSHCFHLHEPITAWDKKKPADVALTYVPTIFNPVWEVSARTFFALETMGQLAQLHDTLFNAWNVENLTLVDEASTTDYLVKHGVDRKKFADAYNSFSMQSKVVRVKQMQQAYNIKGTPTLIVDGKYLITGLQPAKTIQVLNTVIEKARKERTGKK